MRKPVFITGGLIAAAATFVFFAGLSSVATPVAVIGSVLMISIGYAMCNAVAPAGPDAVRAAPPRRRGGRRICSNWPYTVPQGDGILGAPHSADHPLVFGNFCGGIADRYYVQPVAADTEGLGNGMRRAWADFAHTGNPGWAPFTPETLRTMVFDTESTEQRYPHAVNLEAYGRDFPEVLDLLV